MKKYIITKICSDEPVKENICNKPFRFLVPPRKQRCLWCKFDSDNSVYRSRYSIKNVDETDTGYIIRTNQQYVYYLSEVKTGKLTKQQLF